MKEKTNNQKIIKKLMEERNYFIDVKAKISRLLGPKIFELQKENLNNIRNVIIVSGALATFELILLNNPIVQNLNIDLLKISIIGFLLTVIFSSFQLNRELSTGINSYHDKFKENIVTAEKGEKIILKTVCVNALLSMQGEKKGEEIDGNEKIKRFLLAEKIQKCDEIDLKLENIVKIKNIIGILYTPLIVGQVCSILEGNNK